MNHPSVEYLGELPASALKERVVEICRAMREFNVAQREQFSSERGDWPPAGIPSDEFNNAFMKHRRDMADRFNAELRPTALNLRTELQKRLGDRYTAPEFPPSTLDHGMMAGPNPVEEAASELEAMARLLPD